MALEQVCSLDCFCLGESNFTQTRMALELECSLNYSFAKAREFSLKRGGFSLRKKIFAQAKQKKNIVFGLSILIV